MFLRSHRWYLCRWISLAIFPTLHSLAIRPIRILSTANPITRVAAKKLSKLWPRSLCDRQIIESRPVAEWHSTLYTFGVNDEPRHSQNSGGSSESVRDIEQLAEYRGSCVRQSTWYWQRLFITHMGDLLYYAVYTTRENFLTSFVKNCSWSNWIYLFWFAILWQMWIYIYINVNK